LFESQVDVLFAYMAIEEGLIWTLDKPSGGTSKGVADAPGGGIDGHGIKEETGTGGAVVPHRQGGLEMARVDKRAAIERGIDGSVRRSSEARADCCSGGRMPPSGRDLLRRTLVHRQRLRASATHQAVLLPK
jgi:hypothetical protein